MHLSAPYLMTKPRSRRLRTQGQLVRPRPDKAVQDVAVVVIFLSAGYFASRNCRPSDAHPPIRCAQLRDQSRLRAMSEQ